MKKLDSLNFDFNNLFQEMSLRCIGSWRDKKNQQYFIVQNEENEEYRCGV